MSRKWAWRNPVYQGGQAIAWLRDHYTDRMKVDTLAELAYLSPSSFHRTFKSVTGMSPLQFQKVLRLQEARRLMLTQMLDVQSASVRVGYQIISQFSREYSRFFGVSPSKDIRPVHADNAQFNIEQANA